MLLYKAQCTTQAKRRKNSTVASSISTRTSQTTWRLLMFPPKPPQTSPPARCGGDAPERLIVAVKAENANISKSGLAWALTHAAKPGDYITLLAVFSRNKTGNSILWNNFALTFCLHQPIQK